MPVVAREEMLLFLRGAPDTLAPVARVPALADAPARVTFAPDLAWLGGGLGAEHVAPGDALPVTLVWRRLARSPRIHHVEWMLFDGQGQRVLWRSHPLGYVLWPDGAWRDDAARAMRWWLVVPSDLPPGRYRLAFAIAWRDPTVRGAGATGILRQCPRCRPTAWSRSARSSSHRAERSRRDPGGPISPLMSPRRDARRFARAARDATPAEPAGREGPP